MCPVPRQVMLSPAMQGVILAIAKARQTFDRDGSEAGLVKVPRWCAGPSGPEPRWHVQNGRERLVRVFLQLVACPSCSSVSALTVTTDLWVLQLLESARKLPPPRRKASLCFLSFFSFSLLFLLLVLAVFSTCTIQHRLPGTPLRICSLGPRRDRQAINQHSWFIRS